MKLKVALLGTPFILFASGLEDVEKFFQARGFLIAKSGNKTYVCDKGLPYFRPGFPVAIFDGTKVKNPLTGKETFVLLKETGKGQILQSFKTNSIVLVKEDKGVKVGNAVKLDYSTVCFKGSDFSFEELLNTLPVVKSKKLGSCKWAIEETNSGYKVLFNGREVFFAKKELPSYAYAYGKLTLRDIKLVAKPIELKELKEIPVGIDAVKVGKRDIVAIGYSDRVEIYERNGNSLVDLGFLPVPTGVIVGIRVVAVGGKIYILGNAMTSDAEPVSFVATLVGTNPVLMQGNIPYLIGVLNKKAPQKFLFVQTFSNGFGKVYSATLGPTGIEVGNEIKVPEGFRVDTAVYSSDSKLAFIDPSGVLRIYKGTFKGGFEHLIDIDGNFGQSYTSIGIPSVVGDTTLGEVFFPPPPVEVQLFGFKGFIVASNERENIAPLIGDKVLKFRRGKLVFIGETQKGLFEKKPLIGALFNDAVQGFTVDSDGTPFAVSGWKNPLLFRQGGKLYRIVFRYF